MMIKETLEKSKKSERAVMSNPCSEKEDGKEAFKYWNPLSHTSNIIPVSSSFIPLPFHFHIFHAKRKIKL